MLRACRQAPVPAACQPLGAHHPAHLAAALATFTDVGNDREPGLPPHFHRRTAEKAIAEKLGKALSHCRKTR